MLPVTMMLLMIGTSAILTTFIHHYLFAFRFAAMKGGCCLLLLLRIHLSVCFGVPRWERTGVTTYSLFNTYLRRQLHKIQTVRTDVSGKRRKTNCSILNPTYVTIVASF